MYLRLTEEQELIQQTVRKFVEKELKPLENEVLKNEREGKPGISKGKLKELQLKAKEHGFWGVNTPQEYGGADLGQLTLALVTMEIAKTFVPFKFGGAADNILY